MQISEDYFNELTQDSNLLKALTAQNEEVAQLVERLDVALNGESSVERSLLDLVQQVEAMPAHGCNKCETATQANGYTLFCLDCAKAMADHFDLEAHLYHQIAWSRKTFGPGPRTKGVVDHIRKELCEVLKAPQDLSEWIDVIILGFDGAWRSGHSPHQIIDALVSKQEKNESREWPDWRQADPTKAIEHKRETDAPLIGKVLRYSDGPTALFRATSYNTHRYYGDHILGGIQSAHEEDVRLADEDDLERWRQEMYPDQETLS